MVSAALVILTYAVFGQVSSHSFINYDDGQFLYQNPTVMQGLSLSSIRWAFTSTSIGWYPLTWLSHMLDVELWQLRAGTHLLMNVTLHTVTACLLFAALRRLTGDTARSAFVSALFAIHPMHVESVAWASERKDTLSTLFIVLALLFYARNPERRWPVASAFAASLASKQMYVTFPLLLLVVDFWPLRRLRNRSEVVPRILEKIPLLALSLAGCVIAVIGQRNLKAMQSVDELAIGQRVANAAVSAVTYLVQAAVPCGMAVPIPFKPIGAAAALIAVAILATITWAAARVARQRPAIMAGWLWYGITLMPVIGLVQIGTQARADRYTYFAFIGIFLAVAFDPWSRQIPRRALGLLAAIAVPAYAAIAFHQTNFWRSSETLFSHTLAVTTDNAQAEYLLGQALELSDPDRAMPHLKRAAGLLESARARPDWYSQTYVSLGTSMLVKARTMPVDSARDQLIREAMAQYQRALSADPLAPHAQNNLAVAAQLLAQPKPDPKEAAVLRHLQAGAALSRQNHPEDAVTELRNAVQLAPGSATPHVYLALALVQAQHFDAAITELETAKGLDAAQANQLVTAALQLQPGPGNLDALLAKLGSR
ncbi:MAG: hypothetical protein ABIP63_01020 [Thermoanaerobaculia bacterium]